MNISTFSFPEPHQQYDDTISVIVPVYNAEKYLSSCIESILAQTFTNFELILIDDGSPDNCGKICDEYAKNDSRIVVIHKKNEGVSAARNTGIEWVLQHNTGKWITFVDSDDWINANYLMYLYRATIEHNSKISMVNLTYVSTEDPLPEKEYSSSSISPKEAYVDSKTSTIIGFVIGKLFQASLFSGFSFPKGKVYEDLATLHLLMFSCEKIALVYCDLYLYRFNPNSITNSKWSISHMTGKIYACSEIEKFFMTYGDQELYRIALLNYGRCLGGQFQALEGYTSVETTKKPYYQDLKRRIKYVLKNAKQNRIQIVQTFPDLCNIVYPRRMWLSWQIKGIKNRIRKRK